MSVPAKSQPKGHELWQVQHRQAVYACPPWITVERQRIRLPEGKIVEDYHQVLLPDYCVMYVETPEGLILVERQYKHGVGDITLTLPAGLIKPDEDPLLAAKRELLEETGFEATDWRPMGKFVQNANYGGSRAHLYAAKNARKVAEADSGDLEHIELVLMPRAEVFAALRENRFQVTSFAATIALATHPELT